MSKEITFYFDTGGQIDLPIECLVRYQFWHPHDLFFAIAGVRPEDADRLICDRSIYRFTINNNGVCSTRDIVLFSTEDDPNGREQQNKYESVYVGRYGTIFIYIGESNIEDFISTDHQLAEIDMEYRERNI